MKTKLPLLIILIVILLSMTSIAYGSYIRQSNYDLNLESGFPVPAISTGGTYQGGAVAILVGNFDSDPRLEFSLTALASGPLYAWNSDSSLLRGWPPHDFYGAAYSAAGNLTGTSDTLEIVTAYWEPAEIVAYAGDGSKLPGWPKDIFGRGIFPPSLADVDNDGYDEIFVNMDDMKLYGFKADGTDIPGWPVDLTFSQEYHTPAIGDIDNDGDLEIVTASGSTNGQISVDAFHHDGIEVAGFPIIFYGYVNTFPVIGDVDGDGNLEIIVFGHYANVYIYSGNGALERTLVAQGGVFYGPSPALADLDKDGLPEIIVATHEALNIWNGDGSNLPGWPVTGYEFYADDSSPLVGDIDGDQALEIVMCGVDGTYAFNLNGNIEPRFPKTSGGLSGAIADIDLDGHNEIIVSDGLDVPNELFPNWIRVYDLGGSAHGKIEWGQFGGGPEHRGVYPVPQIPSPKVQILASHFTYLPIVHVDIKQPSHELHGKVTMNGDSISSIPLELRYFNGSNWSTIANTVTASDGTYVVRGVPDLTDGESYYFKYTNTGLNPDRLFSWSTRSIYVYSESGNVGFSDFDITSLPLVSPLERADVTFPVTFEWITRTATLSDRFSFVLYDPTDGNPALIDYPFRDTNGVILYSLPSGFEYNTQYAWTIWVVSPEGAIGIPLETRYITFSSSNGSNKIVNNPPSTLQPLNWSIYPDLPCQIYPFLTHCLNK